MNEKAKGGHELVGCVVLANVRDGNRWLAYAIGTIDEYDPDNHPREPYHVHLNNGTGEWRTRDSIKMVGTWTSASEASRTPRLITTVSPTSADGGA